MLWVLFSTKASLRRTSSLRSLTSSSNVVMRRSYSSLATPMAIPVSTLPCRFLISTSNLVISACFSASSVLCATVSSSRLVMKDRTMSCCSTIVLLRSTSDSLTRRANSLNRSWVCSTILSTRSFSRAANSESTMSTNIDSMNCL